MIKESIKRYKMYEYIRDNEKISAEMSGTKKLIIKLMKNDEETLKYCNRKMQEEKNEVKEAMIGKHHHENMTKREILVNEISQYIYWQTVIAISKSKSCEDFNEEAKIREILKEIDVSKIGEKEKITVKEVINHDLEQMEQKEYLKNFN